VAKNRVIAAIFCMILFCVATVSPVAAQNQSTSHSFSSTPTWQPAEEITFGAAIQQVVEKQQLGAPGGLNLLMDGSRGVLYVNLGPYLHSDVRQSLSSGQVIQVVGIVHSFSGKNYLLARQLVIGNQTIDIRNSHGSLIHTPPAATAASTRTRSGQIGGVR
jgi:hypothetical protein